MRACAALAIAVAIHGSPVEAQVQSTGWPEPAGAAKVAKPALTRAATAAERARPAHRPKPAVAAPKPDALRAAVVDKAAGKPAANPVAEPAVKAPAPELVVSEVVQLLQQQTELLRKLAAEVESQQALIKEQQDKIKAIELKSTETSAAAAPAVRTPPPAAILVDTGGIKLRVSGLFQGWYAASDAAVVDTFRLRRAELKFRGDISPRLKGVVMVDPAKTLSLSTSTGSMSGQTVVTGASVSQSGRLRQDAFVSLNWRSGVWLQGHYIRKTFAGVMPSRNVFMTNVQTAW